MKKVLLYSSILIILAAASCDNSTMNESDSKADTAVLVEDPANTLDANPVNDTTVIVDTVHTH